MFPFPESLENAWEFIEDTAYEVNILAQYVEEGSDAITIVSAGRCFYGSTCITEKKVEKLFTSIDVECEDCDDADLSKALLAKSLLKNLKATIPCHL